jgi:hypothetical protein
MDISDLKSLVGKKLIWCGIDEEAFFLLFEGFSMISITDWTRLTDSRLVLEAILKDNLENAQSILALKKLLEEGEKNDAAQS